jgi:hypothetical protein
MQERFTTWRSLSVSLIAGIVCFFAMTAGVPGLHAATLTVTTTADSGAGSLRQALADAIDGDTIQFAPGLTGQTIGLTSTELAIDKNITITGPGPDQLAVQRFGPSQFRIFHVMPGHTVTIAGLKITGGTVSNPDTGGGGVRNDQATLTLNNCAVVSNSGFSLGGGIYNNGGNARLTIANCAINNNQAGPSGGTGGGGIYNDGVLEISDSTISGNTAAFSAGIRNNPTGKLSIRNSVISFNFVPDFSGPGPPLVGNVGGIYSAGTAEITTSTINNNRGGGGGGGIEASGPLTIANSTINNNTTINAGGGIRSFGPLTLTNSTVSGNFASFKGGGSGGGVYCGGAPVTITNSTISGNSCGTQFGHGGGIYAGGGSLEIENTILKAGSSGANLYGNSIISHGYNLSSDDGSGFLTATGDQINTDPILGPLQNNGGPTFTQALLPGSPAIDTGDPDFTPPPFYDQRGPGFDRVHNGRIDIGSFELVGPVRIVSTTADSGAGSLRQAIADANNGDTIQFAAPLNGQAITITTAELLIDKSIAISGPGPGQLTVQRSAATETPRFSIFHILPGQSVTIAGLTIRKGAPPVSPGWGGGILNDHAILTVTNCDLRENAAANGAGIYNDGTSAGSATLTVNASTFFLNQANYGGGLFNGGSGGHAMTMVNNSMFTNDTAGGGAAFFNSGDNGGVGTLTISNSTLSNNFASVTGGALLNVGAGALTTIANSTLVNNTDGDPEHGRGVYDSGGSIEIGNTILSFTSIGGVGLVTSNGYNLSRDDGGGFLTATGDQTNTDPLLGPLQNNGGPTLTHALLFGSPAIDAGNPNFTPPADFDQRGIGFPRVLNGRINTGSVEMQPAAPTPPPTPTPPPPSPTPTPSATATATSTPSPTATPTATEGPCGVSGFVENFDGVTPPTLPSGWTAANAQGGTPLWVTSNAGSPSPPADTPANAVFVPDFGGVTDERLDSPSISLFGTGARVTFRHNFNLQSGFDGGVLEISISGGAFQDVIEAGGVFVAGGYNSTISVGSGSPIAGRQGWSGNSGGFITTVVSLPQNTAFRSFQLRWRLGTDSSVSGVGWRVDTIRLTFCPKPPPPPTATPTAPPTATPTQTPAPSPTPTPAPSPAQALNISTRLRVETGSNIAIGGFIITGIGPKKVAIRGIGPSLGNFGLSDVLADPTLELRGSDGALVAQNDNWQDNSFQAAQLVGLNLALPHPNESGIVAILEPGAYTALLAGKNQTSGIALVEIYDADAAAASQLANISTRGFVRTGDNVMIGGFILGNSGTNPNIIVRGIGPSLDQFGLNNVLADPTLELRDSNGALLVANDNWQDDPVSGVQLANRALAPSRPEESGIFTSLPPGAFTAIVAGKDGAVGLGLVEVYNVP